MTDPTSSALAVSELTPATDTKRIATITTSRLSGAVVTDPIFPCAGIASDHERQLTLLIAGCFWLDDRDRQLGTPEGALSRIADASGTGEPSLRGNYAFVLVDAKNCTVLAERSEFGVVPLYYARPVNGLIVSTSLRALRRVHPSHLCIEAAQELLSIGFIVSNRTLMDGVQSVPAGAQLTTRDGRSRMTAFPLPLFLRNRPLDDEGKQSLDDAFERAIARYAAHTPSLSVPLSGGIDSRIALLEARRQGLQVRSWSAGEPGSLETRVATDVCKALDVPIRVHANDPNRMPAWFDRAVWLTEGRCPPMGMHFLDALFSGSYYPQPQLHGLVGDVVVGGDLDLDDARLDPSKSLLAHAAPLMRPIVWWPRGSYDELALAHWMPRPEAVLEREQNCLVSRLGSDVSYSGLLWLRYHFRIFGYIIPSLVSQVRPWTEILTPYLDPSFFATCAALSHQAIGNRAAQIQWALRRHPELAAIPRVKDGVLMAFSGEEAGDYAGGIRRLERQRRFRYLLGRLTFGRLNLPHPETYPNYPDWFRRSADLRHFFRQRLLSDHALNRGLWSRCGVERLLKDLRRGRDTWSLLATLLLLDSFLRTFVEGDLEPDNSIPPPAR